MSIIEREPQVQQQPAELDEVGEILVHAARLIERDGWWQGGKPMKTGGESCLMISIARASLLSRTRFSANKRLYESFGLDNTKVGTNYKLMTEWNDAPERTKEQVIEALERAAYGC